MNSTADTYFAAARENLDSAQWLHDQNHFYLAHYFFGLAVECMLRAYLTKITKEWDSRHDLYQLAKESRFFDIVPQNLQEEYGTKFTDLNRRWRSNHRYYSERQLLTYWNTLRLDYTARGNRIEQISRVALNLAHQIVNLGVAKWQTTK